MLNSRSFLHPSGGGLIPATFVRHLQLHLLITPLKHLRVLNVTRVHVDACSVLKLDFVCSSTRQVLFLLVMCTSLHVTSHFHSPVASSCTFHAFLFLSQEKIIKLCRVISTQRIILYFSKSKVATSQTVCV